MSVAPDLISKELQTAGDDKRFRIGSPCVSTGKSAGAGITTSSFAVGTPPFQFPGKFQSP